MASEDNLSQADKVLAVLQQVLRDRDVFSYSDIAELKCPELKTLSPQQVNSGLHTLASRSLSHLQMVDAGAGKRPTKWMFLRRPIHRPGRKDERLRSLKKGLPGLFPDERPRQPQQPPTTQTTARAAQPKGGDVWMDLDTFQKHLKEIPPDAVVQVRVYVPYQF